MLRNGLLTLCHFAIPEDFVSGIIKVLYDTILSVNLIVKRKSFLSQAKFYLLVIILLRYAMFNQIENFRQVYDNETLKIVAISLKRTMARVKIPVRSRQREYLNDLTVKLQSLG